MMAFLKAWTDITFSDKNSKNIYNDKIFNISNRLAHLINKNLNN